MIEKAKQLWLDTTKNNQYADLLHTFTAGRLNGDAVMEIYCETEYVLYINGNTVGSGQYRSFDNKRVFDSYDITPYIKDGENQIYIIGYHQGFSTQTYACGAEGVAFAIASSDGSCVLSDETTKIRADANYKSGEAELATPQLGYVYHYDAAKPELPWTCPRIVECSAPYTKRPVKKLSRLPVKKGKICTQGILKRVNMPTVAESMQNDFLSYRDKKYIFDGNVIRKNNDGVYFIIDLGSELAGLFTMKLTAGRGTEIDFGYGEHTDDLRVRTYVGERCFASSYICKDGEQSFTGFFRRFAGRYISVHITNMSDDVIFDEIGLIPVQYSLTNKESFRSEDYFYNRLYDVSINTLKLCMHEHYEDCPWREQALYAFDSFVQMRCGYYAFGEYEFARASLELLADGQLPGGLLELSAPGKRPFTIPSFALCWIMSLQCYVLFSGDLSFGEKMLPAADRILKAFCIKDNLVIKEDKSEYWHFYEWSYGLDGGFSPVDSVLNFYYIMACESYNEILKYLGREAEYDTKPVKKKVYEKFFDKETGLFRTAPESSVYHELTQALAILSGCIDRDPLSSKLMNKNNGLVKTTLSTSVYKYDALLLGDNKYLDFVTDDIAETWGKMIYSGAGTLWETAVGADDFSKAGSLCHGWSAVPVYILYRYHIGFYPTSPGFKTYNLKSCKSRIGNINAALYMPGNPFNIKTEM